MPQPIPGQPPPRGVGGTSERRRRRLNAWLVLGARAWLFIAMVAARPILADERAGHIDRARPLRPSVTPWLRTDAGGTGSTGLDNGWSGMACLALVLVACGGVAVLIRRMAPRATAGAVQVVGRVGLSPKHSVYLLRVGRRILVLGAGPQGPPALIAELDDIPEDPPAAQQGAES